jgi:hypothetical protein
LEKWFYPPLAIQVIGRSANGSIENCMAGKKRRSSESFVTNENCLLFKRGKWAISTKMSKTQEDDGAQENWEGG